MNCEPYEVGSVVIGQVDLPSCGVRYHTAQRITGRLERRMVPGGPLRWYYALDGGKPCVLAEYVKPAQGVVQVA